MTGSLKSPTTRKILLTAFDALLAGAAAAYYAGLYRLAFAPCFYYTHFGVYCAGCGGTRAINRLAHFDVAGALHANVLYVALAAYAAVLFFGLNYAVFFEKPFPKPLFRLWYLYVIAGTTLLFLVVRNIPAWPFILLNP